MIIVIAIRDIWRRFDEESLALKNLGLEVPEVIQLAFGYAALSAYPGPVVLPHSTSNNIFVAVKTLLQDRLPHNDRLSFTRQSGYGLGDQVVYKVVDIVGEISSMLADAVIQQLGSFPPQLRFGRCLGKDLTLTLEQGHTLHAHRRFAQG